MLRSIKKIMGLPIEALDGIVGKSKDCLFDERYWAVRYLVADTGNWLKGNKVLISPLHLEKPKRGVTWLGDRLPVELSSAQIEGCPKLREDAPVSRQYEAEYARYYGHQGYWMGPEIWGMSHYPLYAPSITKGKDTSKEEAAEHEVRMKAIEENPLRSAKELIGYHIDARGEDFGHIEDFLIDDHYWRIHYIIIDSRNWLPGRKFLIDIDWIEEFSWQKQKASVDLTRKQIENSPELKTVSALNKEYIKDLHDYYGKRREELDEVLGSK